MRKKQQDIGKLILKNYVLITIFILTIFGIILYYTQKKVGNNSSQSNLIKNINPQSYVPAGDSRMVLMRTDKDGHFLSIIRDDLYMYCNQNEVQAKNPLSDGVYCQISSVPGSHPNGAKNPFTAYINWTHKQGTIITPPFNFPWKPIDVVRDTIKLSDDVSIVTWSAPRK